MLVAREARWPRVVLTACELGWPYMFEGYFRLMSVSSVTSRSTCISGSRCAIVFHSCYTWLYFVVFERHFYTIGELWPNSFNANARKSKQQFWIQKVDANPCLGELLWSNNRMPNWNLAWAKIDDSKKLAAEKHRFAQRRSRQQETEERLRIPVPPKSAETKNHFRS